MDSGIFLLQADNSLMRMNEQPYEAEDLLQKLLADHSDLLAGDQINTDVPRRWLFIGREIGVPGEEDGTNRWSLDHLFLDQDSVPTFVETKRSSDTRARREVVAQMLDYAANATTYWPVSRMRELYAQGWDALGVKPEEYFQTNFDEEIDAEEFWARADQNLRAGRVRMLFVSDRIPTELRRIVEFLNQQMNPAEVLALEVKQYTGSPGENQLRTLVPRIIGQTEASLVQKRSGSASQPRSPVSVADFSGLFEDENHRAMVYAILDASSRTRFEHRPHATPKANSVRLFSPGNRGDAFALSTDKLVWINIRNDEQLRTPEFVRELQSVLLEAFPERQLDINNLNRGRSGLGLRFDRVATEAGLAAVIRAIELADAAIFDVPTSQQTATEGEI